MIIHFTPDKLLAIFFRLQPGRHHQQKPINNVQHALQNGVVNNSMKCSPVAYILAIFGIKWLFASSAVIYGYSELR